MTSFTQPFQPFQCVHSSFGTTEVLGLYSAGAQAYLPLIQAPNSLGGNGHKHMSC